LVSASPDARIIGNQKTIAVLAIRAQIRSMPEEADIRTLEPGDLYLCDDSLDEALTVLVRVICPPDEDRIVTMEEYRESFLLWVSRQDLEGPLTHGHTTPVAEQTARSRTYR
jgi:hypothetical protein